MGIIKSVIKVFEIIYEEAERELVDETPYMEALDELYIKLEKCEITEEQYEIEEEEILESLREIRRYKKEHEIREE